MGRKILVAYATKYSHTQKVAEHIAQLISGYGYKADAINVAKDHVFVDRYDGIIVGGPIYAGKYPRSLKKWLKAHRAVLNQKYCAFFSVCLGILQKEQRIQAEERSFVEGLFNETNWYPQTWAIFAGAITYSKYNWFTKLIMYFIARNAGQKTVMSRDYECTNWEDVKKFVSRYLLDLNAKTGRDFRESVPQEVKSEGTGA